MATETDINKRILESLEHLHIRLDNIERLLENKKVPEKSPKKEGPSNHGARWTPEQEEWMLNAIAKNTSIDKIAEKREQMKEGI